MYNLFWIIAIVLIILFLLGLVTHHILGGLIYILLVVALILAIVGSFSELNLKSRSASMEGK